MAEKEAELAVFDSKKMLKDLGKAETKIKYNDRMAVEVIAATKFHKVGDILNPHKVKAEAMISQKIAKKYTAPEPKDSE